VLIALLFVPVQYNVSAPAHLEGAIQRSLVAPESGFLKQSHVRPGDTVKAGQLLAELEDQELQLEKRKWESELSQNENAYGASLADADRAQLVINQSKADEARTELALTEQKLTRSHILAPFDGIIIKGDLRQSLGAPVQRGDVLLTISPVDAFRLMIEVDEREVAFVRPQQEGRVALVSLPDRALAFKIERITPVATTKEGRNFFEVEATLVNKPQNYLRPGLEGVAKIDVGQRPFIWIWTHRVLDTIRLALWSWGLI
jgi:RND family efflux transporter MFP subunit